MWYGYFLLEHVSRLQTSAAKKQSVLCKLKILPETWKFKNPRKMGADIVVIKLHIKFEGSSC